MLRKSKKNNKVVLLLPIVLLIITLLIHTTIISKDKNEYMDNTKVLSTITQVLEVNTVKYTYSNIISITKDKSINDIKIPFTQQSFIIKYNGVINGGVKPEDIKILENNENQIVIQISKCRILDHYIDDTNVYVYDIKKSIFNKLNTNEILSDISKHKSQYEEKLIEEGFLDEIKINTKTSLENLLKNIGYNDVQIKFNWIYIYKRLVKLIKN